MDNMTKYKEVFKSTFNVSDAELDDSFTFANIDRWDSFTHLSLITALEDEFQVVFEPDDILHYGSFNNGISIMKKYGVDM